MINMASFSVTLLLLSSLLLLTTTASTTQSGFSHQGLFVDNHHQVAATLRQKSSALLDNNSAPNSQPRPWGIIKTVGNNNGRRPKSYKKSVGVILSQDQQERERNDLALSALAHPVRL